MLNANFIVEPSNIEEPETQDLASSHSAESAQVRDRIADAADFLRCLDQCPRFLRCRRNNLAVLKGRLLYALRSIRKSQTAPECAWALPACKHIAQQHYCVVDRLRSEFILDHPADSRVDILEPDTRNLH